MTQRTTNLSDFPEEGIRSHFFIFEPNCKTRQAGPEGDRRNAGTIALHGFAIEDKPPFGKLWASGLPFRAVIAKTVRGGMARWGLETEGTNKRLLRAEPRKDGEGEEGGGTGGRV